WEGKENKGVDFYCTDFKLEFVIFQTMAEEYALSFDNFKGCVCSDYLDVRVVGGQYSGSNQTQSKNVKSAKELWDSLESKYMAEDASSKKFLVSNFNNYKMVNFRPVMEQFNELLRILGQYIQHGLKIDESISVSSMIDKLPPSWKDFKHSLKHGKDNMSLVQLEKGGKNKNNKQNKGKKHGFKDNNGGSGSNKKPKLECWKCDKTSHFKKDCRSGNKKNNTSVDAIAWWIDSGAITHICKYRCWFNTYKPVEDGSVLYMGDDHFAPVHGKGSVVLEFSSGKSITLFNVLVPNKRNKTTPYELWYKKRLNLTFLRLYLVEGSRDQIGSQYSYCYSIEEDPRTYNEAMQSLNVSFWKEAIDDEIGYIMENNTWVLSDLPLESRFLPVALAGSIVEIEPPRTVLQY
ncbi:zinc finger, CCHC-type containing protein, partial [Tanacetum coccineum]